MTEKIKKKLVGFFVLGAVIILIIALMLLGSGTLFKDSFRFVCYFTSSLKGLNVGSYVLFHGVRVGRVTNIYIVSGTGSEEYSTPVVIEIDKDLMFNSSEHNTFFTQDDADEVMREHVRNGLRAQLGTQSMLTGQLSVELNVLSEHENKIDVRALPTYDDLMQIPTIETPLEAIINQITNIPFKDMMEATHSLFAELNKTLETINQYLNGGEISQFLAAYTSLADNANKQISELGSLKTDIQALLISLADTSISVESLVAENKNEITSLLKSFTDLSVKANLFVTDIAAIAKEDSPAMIELSRTMQALQNASISIAELANLLEIKPDALIFGK